MRSSFSDSRSAALCSSSLAAGAPSMQSEACPSRSVVGTRRYSAGALVPHPRGPDVPMGGGASCRGVQVSPDRLHQVRGESPSCACGADAPSGIRRPIRPGALEASERVLQGPKRREGILPTCRALHHGGAKRRRGAIVAHGGRITDVGQPLSAPRGRVVPLLLDPGLSALAAGVRGQ